MSAVIIRDIHQLRDSPQFSIVAVDGLLSAEAALKEAMRYVPYGKEHHGVWSPAFTRIILDAASQVDSVWKAVAKQLCLPRAGDRMTISDHFDEFGALVAKERVVFFGGSPPCALTPFGSWQNGYSRLDWWEAYNLLKHDRFSHQSQAKREHAVNAVAALLLTVIYCGICDLALNFAMLLDPSSSNPWAYTKSELLRDVSFECHAKFETKLFAHPLGIFAAENCNLSNHWISGSPRFNIWWALNAQDYTMPFTRG